MPITPSDSLGSRPIHDHARGRARYPSRRSFLWAGGVAMLALGASACEAARDQVSPPPSQTPDQQARSRAADQEQRLAELARTTAAAYPTVTWVSDAGRAHTAHAAALRETLAPSRSTGAASSASPGASTPGVPASETSAVRALAAAELAASREHRRALATAGISGEVARLLASIAASDAAFSRTLRDRAART